jgi:YjjG family noncanonical pyrimidine nucleotidase
MVMKKRKFKAVFFDLDHTLWDFEVNSEETITGLLQEHGILGNQVAEAGDFMGFYRSINKELWDRYHANAITKEELRVWRFSHSFRKFGIEDHDLSLLFADKYLEICPGKTALFPGAIDSLEALIKDHSLHIITNGFKEVQYRKLKNSGLIRYFEKVHISEEIGWKKPEPEIFQYALKEAGAAADESVMVGDNPDTDIAGAMNAGIQAILFDPEGLFEPAPPVWKARTLTETAQLILSGGGK